MINLPKLCLRKSVNSHNIDPQIFADWIEGSLRFETDEISKSDIVDVLLEESLYTDQDFAAEFVETAWREIRRRLRLIGPNCAPFEIVGNRLIRTGDWRDFPGYSFCLILSFLKWYSAWAKHFGVDYTEQGALFEELTKVALETLLPEFEIFRTGWAKDNPVSAVDVIRDVADRMGEPQGDLTRWIERTAKEVGLDLVCYREFLDNRVARPVFLIQCASGANWDTKLLTPAQAVWNRVIGWASTPKKGFAMPFSLSEDEFNRSSLQVDGLFVDRYRLLSACHLRADWIPNDLRDRIIAWLEPRIARVSADMTPPPPPAPLPLGLAA